MAHEFEFEGPLGLDEQRPVDRLVRHLHGFLSRKGTRSQPAICSRDHCLQLGA